MTTTRTNHGTPIPLEPITPAAPTADACRCENPGPHFKAGSNGKFCTACGKDIPPCSLTNTPPPAFDLANMDLLAIGHDPETYNAYRIKGREALHFWAWNAYGSLADADPDHAADMAKELNDPDSWQCVDGQAVHFETSVGEGGSVDFYLITD